MLTRERGQNQLIGWADHLHLEMYSEWIQDRILFTCSCFSVISSGNAFTARENKMRATVRFGEALKHFDVDFLRVRMVSLPQTIKSSSPITSSFSLNCIKKQDRNNFRQSFKGELIFATWNKGKILTWSQQKDLKLVVLVLREEKLPSGKVTTSMTTALHFDVRSLSLWIYKSV